MDDDPFRWFRRWWSEAEVPMVVATAGPAARAVVLEQFDERGFCFWTSSESPTGRQLAAEPRAALVWLWDWVGYRVVPERFEFWGIDPAFLHDRFEFTRAPGGTWRRTRLQP